VPSRYVVFSHGKDSGPWGKKISALAETARAEGYQVESIDYRGLESAEERVTHLVDGCRELQGELVLVGSSLGGFVSAAAASVLHARGLFLMAPAIYMRGLPALRPNGIDCPMTIVHGWRDQIIPLEHTLRFAKEYAAPLHIVNDDHGLHASVGRIKYLLEYFLISIDLPSRTE